MNVEAYIIIRPLIDHCFDNRMGVPLGIGADYTFQWILQYKDIIECEFIDISKYITENGINAWHEQADEKMFTNFESSDIGVDLDLLTSDGGRRITIPNEGHFWNKLPSAEKNLWNRFQDLAHRIDARKLERWDVSIYFPDLKRGFYGVIDFTTLDVNEDTGHVTFTAYDGLKILQKIPSGICSEWYLSGVTNRMRWKYSISPGNAYLFINDKVSRFMNEFQPAWVTGLGSDYMRDYTGWSLSTLTNPIQTIDLTDVSLQMTDFRYDGDYLWILTQENTTLKVNVADWTWEETADFVGHKRFCQWEQQLELTETPKTFGTDLPTMMPQWDGTNFPVDNSFATWYNYLRGRLYYFQNNDFNPDGWLRYREFTNYIAGVPTWGAEHSLDGCHGGFSHLQAMAVNRIGNIVYLSTGTRLLKYVDGGVGLTVIDEWDKNNRDNAIYNPVWYAESDILITTRVTESGDYLSTEIRDGTTGEIQSLGKREGDVEPLKEYSSYQLEWGDVDWNNTFEIRLNISGASQICFIGITKTSPYRLFILNSSLTKCINFTNLETLVDLPRGSKCFLTRIVTNTVTGGLTTSTASVLGYIGDGTPGGGLFFQYKQGHSTNIRVLGLKDLSVFDAYTELAKFTNCYFYVQNNPIRMAGKNIMLPRCVFKSRFSEGELHLIDNIYKSWKWTAQYKGFYGIVKVKYNGGETKSGAGVASFPRITLASVYGIDTLDIEYKFIFDQNLAEYRGGNFLQFFWESRQHWITTIEWNENIEYNLIDLIRLRYSAGGEIPRNAQIIAMDFNPYEKQIEISAITVGKKPAVIDNPFPQAVLTRTGGGQGHPVS